MSITILDAAWIAAIVAALLGLMVGVRVVAPRWGLSAELQRKSVHVATGLTALTFPWLFSNAGPVLILSALSIVVMTALRTPAFARSKMSSVLHSVSRKSYGEICLSIATAFVFFRSQGEPVLYVLPMLVIALSDTASAMIGTNYGRRMFAVEDGAKSAEGVAAFFLITWLIAMIVLLLMTDTARSNVVILGFMIAAFGALVEAVSWKGLDNLFVPVAIHFFLATHIGSPPLDLLYAAILFVVVISTMIALMPMLKYDRHTAQAYSVLLFVMFMVTAEPRNHLLPCLAIIAHMIARRIRPSESQHPDLELLAAAAFTALFWLATGELSGLIAIDLYNLTFAGAAIAFAGLALPGKYRFAVIIPAMAAGAIYLWAASLNMEFAAWWHPAYPPLILSFGLILSFIVMAPGWFDRRRVGKVFALAFTVPAVAFILKGVVA